MESGIAPHSSQTLQRRSNSNNSEMGRSLDSPVPQFGRLEAEPAGEARATEENLMLTPTEPLDDEPDFAEALMNEGIGTNVVSSLASHEMATTGAEHGPREVQAANNGGTALCAWRPGTQTGPDTGGRRQLHIGHEHLALAVCSVLMCLWELHSDFNLVREVVMAGFVPSPALARVVLFLLPSLGTSMLLFPRSRCSEPRGMRLGCKPLDAVIAVVEACFRPLHRSVLFFAAYEKLWRQRSDFYIEIEENEVTIKSFHVNSGRADETQLTRAEFKRTYLRAKDLKVDMAEMTMCRRYLVTLLEISILAYIVLSYFTRESGVFHNLDDYYSGLLGLAPPLLWSMWTAAAAPIDLERAEQEFIPDPSDTWLRCGNMKRVLLAFIHSLSQNLLVIMIARLLLGQWWTFLICLWLVTRIFFLFTCILFLRVELRRQPAPPSVLTIRRYILFFFHAEPCCQQLFASLMDGAGDVNLGCVSGPARDLLMSAWSSMVVTVRALIADFLCFPHHC